MGKKPRVCQDSNGFDLVPEQSSKSCLRLKINFKLFIYLFNLKKNYLYSQVKYWEESS